MSIRLRSGGLAFTLWYDHVGGSVHSEYSLPLPSGHSSWQVAIQDLFFQHELLSLPYRSVSVVCRPAMMVLVPREHYRHGEEGAWLESVSAPPREQGDQWQALTYAYTDEEKELIYAFPQALYQFLLRTHPRLEIIPEGVGALEPYKRNTRVERSRVLYINLYEEGIDCWCIDQGATTFANQYAFVHRHAHEEVAEEVAFYALALWRALLLQIDTDRLVLAYMTSQAEGLEAHLCDVATQVTSLLTPYISAIATQTYQASQI